VTTELQQNRYDAILRRVGDLKGGGAKVSEVLAELFPVFDVEDLPGELFILGGTALGFGGGRIVAAAGQVPTIQLFNPADSSKLVTITRVIFACINNTVVNWGVTNTVLPVAGIGTETARDTRSFPTPRPSAQIRQISSVVVSTATGVTRTPLNVPFVLDDPNGVAVLREGSGFEIGSPTAATEIFVTFSWRERTAEPSELNA